MSEPNSRKLGELHQSEGEVVRITEERDERGRVRIKFWEWYLKDGEWRAGKGLYFKASQAPALVSAVLSVRPR